jgi:ABC-type microcin C transport system duplicated ATPase subunit YejF
MRLIPQPPGKIMKGTILFKGEDLLKKTEQEMQHIRGNKISMIFQEPMSALIHRRRSNSRSDFVT